MSDFRGYAMSIRQVICKALLAWSSAAIAALKRRVIVPLRISRSIPAVSNVLLSGIGRFEEPEQSAIDFSLLNTASGG
jgi:hypothetical protein